VTELVPLILVVTLAWTIQAITGFGSTVLALTLGAAWVSIPEFLPVVVCLNLPLTSWTVLRHRSQLAVPVLTGLILPWMGLGFVIGMALAPQLGGDALKRGFGVFVLVFAARDLWSLLRDHATARPSDGVLRGWVVLAGIVHGIYGSGGPPLVQATSRLGLDRSQFRATMSAVWLVFNVILIGWYLATGRLGAPEATRIAALMPCVLIGIWLGEVLHHRLPERAFRGLVQVVLLVGGAALLR
jgi:uncharacterized membrane protein YfcA